MCPFRVYIEGDVISDMGKDALASEPLRLKFNMFLKNNSEHSDFCFRARGKKKKG